MTSPASRPRRLVVAAGTGTDVGKTWTTCRLVEQLRYRGLSVAVRKPVQSFDTAQDPGSRDAVLLARASGEEPEQVCPVGRWYPAALAPPMAADRLGLPRIALSDLLAETGWTRPVDVGLVETVGGTRSPVAHDGDSADLARALAPDLVVLVADAGLGAVNAARLGAGALGPLPTVVMLNRFDPGDDLHRRNRDWLAEVDALRVVTDLPRLADLVAG